MTRLEKVSHVASIVETLVILVSVVFIVQQLHSQTRALQAQMSQGLTQLGTSRAFDLLENPDFDRVLQQGRKDYASLDEFASIRYRRYIYTNMFMYEDLYLQYRNGYIDESTFITWRNGMARYRDEMARPQWVGWERNFSPEFVVFFKGLEPREFVGF